VELSESLASPMDDAERPPSKDEAETQKPRSIADGVERLYAGAIDALNRASEARDATWQKFYMGQAAAYKEWATQMEPLVALQAHIDTQVAMFQRRYNLPRLDKATRVRDTHKPETIIPAPTLIETSTSKPSSPAPDETQVLLATPETAEAREQTSGPRAADDVTASSDPAPQK
jgi:hypothetical protein